MKRLISLFMIALILVGCGSGNTGSDNYATETSSIHVETGSESASESESVEITVTDSPVVDVVVTTSEASLEETNSYDAVSATDKSSVKVTIETSYVNQQAQAGLLTAGRWNDNEEFDYFMDVLRDNYWYNMKAYWGFEDFTRYTFEVVDSQQNPLIGARITLKSEQGQDHAVGITDNMGRVTIYPSIHGQIKVDQASIEYNQRLFEILDLDEEDYRVTLDVKDDNPQDVDIMFVVDTTGSMSDELEYLKVELLDVIKRVKRSNSNQLDIRMSGNYYRDHGDNYVVRAFDFTSNIGKVMEQMSMQIADGGGDYEEAVVEALNDAIYKHKWRSQARAKLLFLVLDAPPHHTEDNIEGIHALMKEANEMGIRLIPIASSGIDKETEFLLRFMALNTNGEYIFLTDHSGVGNSHLTPTIGRYEVEQLNDMLVDVINQYVE